MTPWCDCMISYHLFLFCIFGQDEGINLTWPYPKNRLKKRPWEQTILMENQSWFFYKHLKQNCSKRDIPHPAVTHTICLLSPSFAPLPSHENAQRAWDSWDCKCAEMLVNASLSGLNGRKRHSLFKNRIWCILALKFFISIFLPLLVTLIDIINSLHTKANTTTAAYDYTA